MLELEPPALPLEQKTTLPDQVPSSMQEPQVLSSEQVPPVPEQNTLPLPERYNPMQPVPELEPVPLLPHAPSEPPRPVRPLAHTSRPRQGSAI